MLTILATVGLSQIASAQTIAGDAAVQAQWFTGSLEAPSPALPAAGIIAIEPYFVYTSYNGSYDNSGTRHSIPNGADVFTEETVLKYALTDRLSVEALPSFSRNLNNHDSYTGIGDLPVEAEYRFNDEDNKTGFPSITASLGMTLPTGHFDHLNTSLDGFGSGVYSAKEGILFQSLFDTWGHHPMRLRFYGAAYEPISNVSVHDNSVYGTSQGFQGTAIARVLIGARIWRRVRTRSKMGPGTRSGPELRQRASSAGHQRRQCDEYTWHKQRSLGGRSGGRVQLVRQHRHYRRR